MPESQIRVFKPSFPTTDRIAAYIDEAARAGQFSNNGPLVTRFEDRLANHFGVAAAQTAMCSSGTAALEGALATMESAGASWHLPAWTFTATPGAVLRAGKAARFVDVDAAQRASFDPACEFAIDVLPFGAGADWSRAGAPRQTVLVDAAASFDGCANFDFPPGMKVGVIVSLHATKSLPAGEGGVFFSNDAKWVDDFRRWANFGMWGSRVSQIPGTNAKMSEITAAVGLASLDAWPENRQRWVENAEHALRVSTEINLPTGLEATRGLAAPYWNVRLRHETARNEVAGLLANNGIETRRWWGDGAHAMPAYRDIASEPLPNTEEHARTNLGLPFHLGLDAQDFARIGSLIGRYLDDQSA